MGELTHPGNFSELLQPRPSHALYAEDLHRWAMETAEHLRCQAWEQLDWAAVIGEIEFLGISQEHAVRRRMMHEGASMGCTATQPQSTCEARRAPSAMERSFAHTMPGSTCGLLLANVPKPQSVPAMTFSRPTTSA